MREMTCCLTGHRDIPDQEKALILRRTERCVVELIHSGVRYFGVGGAIGYDTYAAQLLFKLRAVEQFRHIKVILVYPFDGFTSRWSAEQRTAFEMLQPQYNKAVCISKYPSKGAYLERDRHLVDCSKHCIAYCTKTTGGTAYTLRYAKSKGLYIRNTALL